MQYQTSLTLGLLLGLMELLDFKHGTPIGAIASPLGFGTKWAAICQLFKVFKLAVGNFDQFQNKPFW